MKALVFYQQGEGYGVRPHAFDWKVGDKISSPDGKGRQTIIKITPATPEIIKFAKSVMDKCNRYAGRGQGRTKFVLTENGVSVRHIAKVWEDGTGFSFFKSNIDMLPDYK